MDIGNGHEVACWACTAKCAGKSASSAASTADDTAKDGETATAEKKEADK